MAVDLLARMMADKLLGPKVSTSCVVFTYEVIVYRNNMTGVVAPCAGAPDDLPPRAGRVRGGHARGGRGGRHARLRRQPRAP